MNWMPGIKNFLITAPSPDAVVNTSTAAAITSGAAVVISHGWTVQLFGIQPSALFACFCGAAIALGFLPQMARIGMFSALLIGTIGGAYATPAIASVLATPHINAVGFFASLLTYLVLGVVFKRVEPWMEKLVDKMVNRNGGAQ